MQWPGEVCLGSGGYSILPNIISRGGEEKGPFPGHIAWRSQVLFGVTQWCSDEHSHVSLLPVIHLVNNIVAVPVCFLISLLFLGNCSYLKP